MINRCMTLLMDELVAEGVEDPLAQPFTLAAIWHDLCRHAGEDSPVGVRLWLEGQLSPIRHGPPFQPHDPSAVALEGPTA